MNDPAIAYDLAGSRDWQAFLTHFELGKGFAFIVLLVTGDAGEEVCRTALERHLAAKSKSVLRVPVSDPEDLKTLAEQLLVLQPDAGAGAIWVSRVVSEDAPDFPKWREAWRSGVANLNQYRNPLRRQFDIPLIFVGAPWLQQVLRESAPDLWSVRTLVTWVEPHTVPLMPDFPRIPIESASEEFAPDPELALMEANRLRSQEGANAAIARLLYRAGLGFLAQYQLSQATKSFTGALLLYRQVGDVSGEANCIRNLGYIAEAQFDFDGAEARYEAARLLYVSLGDRAGEAHCIKGLGDNALLRRDLVLAETRYDEALALYRQAGNVSGEANCYRAMGDIAARRSDLEVARERYEEALSTYRQVGNVSGAANCIGGLGDIAMSLMDYGAARMRYEEAMPLFRQVGSLVREANCNRALGDVAFASSDLEGAQGYYEEFLRLAERTRDPFWLGYAQGRLARVASDPEERTRQLQAAREAWANINRPDLLQILDDEFGTPGPEANASPQRPSPITE